MNLIVVTGQAYPQMGGAQITVWSFLETLHAEYGHTCELLTPYPRKHRHKHGALALSTYRDPDELKTMLKTRRPQVLIASLEPTAEALGVASRFGIPTLAYFQSYEHCEPSPAEKRLWGLNPERMYPSREEALYALRTADILLANSQHVQGRLAQKWGVAPGVLYPNIVLKPLRPGRNPQYITGVCGSAHKGIEIFLALADAFPDERFLLVGDVQPNWYARVRERRNVIVRGRDKPERFLSDSKIVLVPSQWQEPFGRIAVEALGYRIPILASHTGGLAEIVGNSPLGVKHFRSPGAWRKRLGALLQSEELRSEYGALGHARVTKFLDGSPARQLAHVIQQLADRSSPDYGTPTLVRFRGSASHKTAFSMVNAAWQGGLAPAVQIDEGQARPFRVPDVVVDHDYEQDFSRVMPPPSGKWVVVRTWDFGPFPEPWVEKLNSECDQLWVHSQWVRKQAIAGGMNPRRVRVVPLGIDPEIFAPQDSRQSLPTRKRFRFIFAGATVFRKGIDILLRAYRQAFTADDDVCLVIKDHARDVFYKGISYHQEITDIQRDPGAAELVYLNRFLSPPALGSLYRACDVAVFPYRAEGFGIPILEAMACGVPPIVPHFGACLDFCTAESAFLMPVRRISLPVQGTFAFNTLGFHQEVHQVDFAEVPVSTLVKYMRQAYSMSPGALQRKADAAVERAHKHFTWADSTARILKHFAALDRYDTPYRLRRMRREAAKRLEKRETAQQLYQNMLGVPKRSGG